MKIFKIINALTLGGAQFVALDLARRAREEGHEIEIACFRDGPLGEVLRNEGFKVHLLGEKMLDLPAFFRILMLLHSFRPDIVHSHLFRASFWARIACMFFPAVRLVTSVHGYETKTYHHVEKLMSRLSDYMIFPSRFLRNWYRKNIRKLRSDECSVLYPGVNIRPSGIATAAVGPVRIGTLSRLHPVKGIDRLIEACAELKRRSVQFSLLIGGAGRHRAELETLAAKLGISDQCFFAGQVSDQRAFLDGLDIFVAPSREEAFGIHVCEAMERALPIVGARVGGIPELVDHGQTGLLFSPEHQNELADCLEKLAGAPDFRRSAGEKGRRRVETSFNRQTGIEKHLEIFSRLLKKQPHVHFAVSSGELGGGERLALGLMKSLKERGWRVSVTCAGAPLSDALAAAGIEYSVAEMSAGGFFFMTRLLHDLKALRPQIVSSHLNRASLISGILGRLTGLPVVSHIHGLNQKIYYQYSTRQVAVSQAVCDHLLDQGASPRNLCVIKNAIAGPVLAPRKSPEKGLQVAITAKLHANKGHRWALEAIAGHADHCGIDKIHIFGDGPERENLEKLCCSLNLTGLVTFYGFVKQPDRFYSKIDVALLPSLGEGIPLSLLETMRFGIPCIATDIGGIPEIISNDENGLLVKPGAADALVHAFKKIAEPEVYKRLSQASIDRFSSINDYKGMVDQFETLLRQELPACS